MKAGKYIPDRGDIVWLDFNPQKGHEQQGRRPAIVISPKSYNQKTHLALFCPITKQQKGYPFEVALQTKNKYISGVILSDQLKSLDWHRLNADFIDKSDKQTLDTVIAKLSTLIEDD